MNLPHGCTVFVEYKDTFDGGQEVSEYAKIKGEVLLIRRMRYAKPVLRVSPQEVYGLPPLDLELEERCPKEI
jgi:hypothetical protein